MRFYLIVLAIVAFVVPGNATEEKPFFLQFMGEWRSNGDSFGVPAESVMTWSPALDGRFVRLDYRIELRPGPDQTSLFQGIAYYKVQDGDISIAFWADNTGDLHPISAERDERALVAFWGVEGGKQGRTRYDLTAPDKMEVTDWIKTPEGWRQFNHTVFTHVPEPDPKARIDPQHLDRERDSQQDGRKIWHQKRHRSLRRSCRRDNARGQGWHHCQIDQQDHVRADERLQGKPVFLD